LCPAKLIRGEQRLGAAFWDAHVDALKTTNPEPEIVQYEQGGHHLHRMINLAERFSRDLDDFAMRWEHDAAHPEDSRIESTRAPTNCLRSCGSTANRR
jgi:hypothetical protein